MKNKLKAFGNIIVKTYENWIKDEPFRESAVIAYFAIFSIPALLVLVLNFASIFIGRESINNELFRQIESLINPATARQIQKAAEKAGDLGKGLVSTSIGVLIILFGATRVFVHLQKALNHIWEVDKKQGHFWRTLKNSLFSIGLILSIGFLLLISMIISTALTALSHWLQQVFLKEVVYLFYILEFVLSLSVISLLFALIFRFLPYVKMPWRSILAGAFLTGFLFVLLKYGLSFYFAKANPGSMYGAAGSIVLILLWISASSMALFFGAEFTKQYTIYHNMKISIKPGAIHKKTG